MLRLALSTARTARFGLHAKTCASRLICASRFNSTSPLERYKAKLEAKAKAAGATSIDELQEKFKDEISSKKKEMNKVDPLAELEEYERRQAEEIAKEAEKLAASGTTIRSPIDKNTAKLPYKTLQSYVDVDKISKLPQKEIEYLWKARFLNKERTLSATLNDVQFAQIYATAFKNPSFILPLSKDKQDGYEMHFVQWSFVGPNTTHCMITTVAEYKLHKEYAKPHTTLMFHQELSKDKIVLMNGQVESDVPITMDEAQLLVLNVQRFYGGVGSPKSIEKRSELLRSFTAGDEEFDVEGLIKEAASTD